MTDTADHDLAGRRALVTGAASGIGRALTEVLAGRGASVLAVDLNADGLASVADLPGVATLASDVTTASAADAIVAAAVDQLGGLDLVFLNAGIVERPITEHGSPYRAGDLDPASWDLIRAVNIDGVVFGTIAAARAMADTGGGAIVATASVAGLVGYTPAPMYTATKAAVIGWARAMAPALAADGITIDAICPGGVATPMTGRSADQADDQILAPTALAAEMIAVGLDDGSGRAVSVVAGRDPLAEAYEFPPVAGFG